MIDYGVSLNTMNVKLIILIIVSQATLLNCGQKNSTMNIDNIKHFQKNVNYPYSASIERAKVIQDNMNTLKKGMMKKQVIELLTAPDEVNYTYKSIKSISKNNIVGFSLVYILRRNKETGSENEKGEKLLRIHFNDSGKLIWAYSIDIDEFKAIEKE